MPVGKISKFKVLRGRKLVEVSARIVEEVRLLPKEHGYEPVIQMLEVVDDRGLGLDKWLLRSNHLKRSKKGKRPPRGPLACGSRRGSSTTSGRRSRRRTRRAPEGFSAGSLMGNGRDATVEFDAPEASSG